MVGMVVGQQDRGRTRVGAHQRLCCPLDPRRVIRPAGIDQDPRGPGTDKVDNGLCASPRSHAEHVRRDLPRDIGRTLLRRARHDDCPGNLRIRSRARAAISVSTNPKNAAATSIDTKVTLSTSAYCLSSTVPGNNPR